MPFRHLVFANKYTFCIWVSIHDPLALQLNVHSLKMVIPVDKVNNDPG
ncbi:Unknown protein sequence [Pseudomonas amygdali pv. lachrymans]|nr:Unknown protein sequence [Pseudomonas amygdali pv. lachrymans]